MNWQFGVFASAIVAVVGGIVWRKLRPTGLESGRHPVPMPPNDHDSSDTEELIDDLFGDWSRWEYRDLDITAWVRRDVDRRWHVYWMRTGDTIGTAYVTTPQTRNATEAKYFLWYWRSNAQDAANALAMVRPNQLRSEPYPLPDSARLPHSRVLIFRPAQ